VRWHRSAWQELAGIGREPSSEEAAEWRAEVADTSRRWGTDGRLFLQVKKEEEDIEKTPPDIF
jgi:hypothetical protein